jgi:uncharacterized protein (TIGR03435 family)
LNSKSLTSIDERQGLAVNAFGSLPLKSRRAFILIAAACFAPSFSAFAQDKPVTPSPAPASSANPAAFSYDVVSIKPIKLEPGMSLGTSISDDGFTSRPDSLMSLIFQAYPILTSDQIVGLQQSAMAEFYSVQAKMDEETAAALKKLPQDQQQEIRQSMLQAVLADRFNLKVHKETRELPIYNLVIIKNGPKFKETPTGKEDNFNMGWGEISGDGIEIRQLLGMLSGYARRYVVDKTGLTGKYTFSLKWNPFEGQNLPTAVSDQYPQFRGRPDLFIALEEQLGLKLEPAKGPVDVYIIDHVERPTEN